MLVNEGGAKHGIGNIPPKDIQGPLVLLWYLVGGPSKIVCTTFLAVPTIKAADGAEPYRAGGGLLSASTPGQGGLGTAGMVILVLHSLVLSLAEVITSPL